MIMDIATTRPASGHPVRALPAAYQSTGSNGAARDEHYYFQPFGDDGLTFGDILDVINPLQHIPVVSTLYREWTGDGIDPVPRIAGGALFGGVVGAISSLVNVIVDEISGSDVGAHVLAFAGDLLGVGDTEPSEMYADAGVSPRGDGESLSLDVAVGPTPSPAPIADALDVLDWPHLASDPLSGGTLQNLKTAPRVDVLERRMASVRQGQVSDVMVMALSIYEKNEHEAAERVMPRIDILG